MTLGEVTRLLALAAGFDRRTVGESDARAWHVLLADVKFGDAQTALYEHFRTSTDWLMPAHILDGVRRIRRARLDAYGTYLPSPEVADDLETQRRVMKMVADGEPVPPELEDRPRPREIGS